MVVDIEESDATEKSVVQRRAPFSLVPLPSDRVQGLSVAQIVVSSAG